MPFGNNLVYKLASKSISLHPRVFLTVLKIQLGNEGMKFVVVSMAVEISVHLPKHSHNKEVDGGLLFYQCTRIQ